MKTTIALLAVALAAHGASARNVPSNVRSFYDRVKSGRCTGPDKLQGGFHDTEDGDNSWSYCQKGVAGKAVFLHGSGTFANMDIDCDGEQKGGDGRCKSSSDTQSQTAFKGQIPGNVIKDLNANIHPYVVFGNEGDYSPTFDPRAHGIKPLSVMAVVCNNKLIYGVWGDTNGDDAEFPLVGEASLSLATACFGTKVNGNSGHDETDVLYVAFTGDEAVPGKSANWKADNYDDFEASIQTLGDKLIKRLS